MKKYLLISALTALVFCTKETNAENKVQSATEDTVTAVPETPEPTSEPSEITKEQNLKNLNDSLLKIFQNQNYGDLANFIHPEKGLTFSMYGFVDKATAKHFSKEQYLQYLPTATKFTWGKKDGSGEPLVLSIKDYFKNWVYKRNFSTGEYYLNTYKGKGNTLNNLDKVFPGADFTENYIAGSEKYSGMDWNALRFVFEKYDGQYYLVAIVNDQWTI